MKDGLNGGLVRERRIAAGWSVPELARRVGVQAEVIWAIERGELLALGHLPLVALVCSGGVILWWVHAILE